jgi:hypothetical protein
LCGSLWFGCGARSGLYENGKADGGKQPDAPIVVVPECEKDQDCEGFEDKCLPVSCNLDLGKCERLPAIKCDDKDPCTKDTCDSAKGLCVFAPETIDNDKDGHKGPKPGYAAGDPGSCGDDCDDTSAAAFPGNKEVCDGIDNDCNKVVDDGATFVPANLTDVQVDSHDDPAGPSGLAYSGDTKTGYMAGYWGTQGGKTRSYVQGMSVSGDKIGPAVQITNINADATGGSLVWTGDRYGIAWNDRRNNDYEVYFNQIGPDGTKLHADVRITDALGFSLYPQIAFNGLYFLVVWEDERDGPFAVYGQRVDLAGNLVGDNLKLTDGWGNAEAPTLAVGTHGVGVAWNYTDPSEQHRVRFQVFSPEFLPTSKVVDLSGSLSAVFPWLVWNKQSYVTAWYDPDEAPYAAYGSVIDESGTVTVAAKQLTQSPKHSRYPALLPLGDRVMMMYSDDRDGNQGYELYARMLTASLDPQSPETRITTSPGASVNPVPAFGPAGDMGVLFRDNRQDGFHVYFTRLQCVTPN